MTAKALGVLAPLATMGLGYVFSEELRFWGGEITPERVREAIRAVPG